MKHVSDSRRSPPPQAGTGYPARPFPLFLPGLAVSVFCAFAAPGGVRSETVPALADSSIHIPVPAREADAEAAARSDGRIFADICGCLAGRVTIRRDSPEFVPVRWSVRAANGRVVRPHEARDGSRVVLNLAAHEPGVYVVTLTDRTGRAVTGRVRVE